MDNQYYDFLILTERQRAAYDVAYQQALKITHRHETARFAAERAVFVEARRERHERQDVQVAS